MNSFLGGEHLCFLGSGRNEEDQYTHMVVASFLQKHTQYVSLLTGGYIALHNYFSDNINDLLQDHNPNVCIVCAPRMNKQKVETTTKTTQSGDLFGKISAAMKSKSAEVKGKLLDYIVNSNNHPVQEWHVSSDDKIGKRYRNVAPVFSIDDDQDNVASVEVRYVINEVIALIAILFYRMCRMRKAEKLFQCKVGLKIQT